MQYDREEFRKILERIATSGVKLPVQSEEEYIKMRRDIVDSREVYND